MRSFGAAALCVLAIVTECLTAHSDRTRQRSGPIRSVPIAANVKRDVDFDCPEEFGYYPHPNDCTLYYVCVFGGALLESCTGGLMYSHELQTCDWPRNVGCDGTNAGGLEELERLNERDRDPLPPPPPPRRTPPPLPPPRVQPNPVVTSRGQPKFNRDEYEKQQQLYAEVDDLPPVEEIESDRQQRVYRGQPSTIGQVQKDRDGYGQQVVSSRTLNSNIIPASVPHSSGKIGSFSFGTQVDDRRAATATPAPQTYSEDKIEILTDSSALDRLLDIETNHIDSNENTKSRKKRDTVDNIGLTNSTGVKVNASKISDRSDFDEDEEYYEQDAEGIVDLETASDGEIKLDDAERGKRQIRYYLQKGFKNPAKLWSNPKPVRLVGLPQYYYSHNTENTKYQPTYNGLSNNNYNEGSQKPYLSGYSTANPFLSFLSDDDLKSFKPSLRDPFSERFPHAGMNIATQIITKSPPISALKNTKALASYNGGLFNNNAAQNSEVSHQIHNDNNFLQHVPSFRPVNFLSNQDSSLLPSTVVTGKPVKIANSPRPPTQDGNDSEETGDDDSEEVNYDNHKNQKHVTGNGSSQNNSKSEESDQEEENADSSEDESGQKEDDPFYTHEFPEPPYEFTHPKHKYEEIENPFADPNFDFESFLAKLRDSHETDSTANRKHPQSHPIKSQQNDKLKAITDKSQMQESSTERQRNAMNYDGMSTPRPFSFPSGPEGVTEPTSEDSPHSDHSKQKFESIQPWQRHQQNLDHHQQQQQMFSENIFKFPQNAGSTVDAIKPKLQPPNFNDDRVLPIFYNFNRPLGSTHKPHYDKTRSETQQVFTVTQKPLIFFTSTGNPILLSSPKQQYFGKPKKIITLQPHSIVAGKPYSISSMNPNNAYITFKQSTSKPLTTLVNEQLSALHKYWNNPTTATPLYYKSTSRPNTVSEIPKLENIFAQIIKSTPQTPTKIFSSTSPKSQVSSTTKSPPKRRPIPKPSPEMPDYYYDDDEDQYYYEPAVKPKYMPSSEVKPRRPPMAQNDQEYEDSDDSDEITTNSKPTRPQHGVPYNSYKPEAATKNHNDVSAVTKAPEKHSAKLKNVRVPIPVFVDYGTPAPNVIMRPEVSNYEVFHHPRNRTILMRRPIKIFMTGPHTSKPPKYLNQTTLRPYTVRHRLAKPTTVKDVSTSGDNNVKIIRGRMRHHNIVAQMKLTTPRDSHKQETRFTKTKYDDKTNSLEPTESVTPTSYSASPRPKMLYNGSQTYSADQYDPYYAVYDEDGELYKDTDYVQQYNTASLRPAVQQTYRGTPPTPRRPVESYTPRPTQVDYDDALIHGQINNNQYQSAIRPSTRGEGNELGYDHIPTSVKTTLYEATYISTTPSTTSTSTTLRSTTAPFTEAMTPSRYTPRLSTDENPNRAPESLSGNPNDGSESPTSSTSSSINFSALAKPFEKTDNTHRLKETLTSTEKLVTKLPIRLTNNIPVDVVQPTPNKDGKNVVSLTSGFSIRRNPNKVNNPYTLTVLTRPLESYNRSQKFDKNWNVNDAREESVESEVDSKFNDKNISSRRNDASQEIESNEHNNPIYMRPMRAKVVIKPRIKSNPTQATLPSTKYILKTVIKRPAPFSSDDEPKEDSTENIISTDALIETALLNARNNGYLIPSNKTDQNDSPKWDQYRAPERAWDEKTTSPYKLLDASSNDYHKEDKSVQDYISSTASNNRFAPTSSRQYVTEKPAKEVRPSKSYYSYSVVDEEVPDPNPIFSTTVKNIIKSFFNNFAPSPSPKAIQQLTTPKMNIYEPEEKIVNIGFQKKILKYADEKPLQSNVKRLQIFTEPSYHSRYGSPGETFSNNEASNEIDQHKDFSSTSSTTSTTPRPFAYTTPEVTSAGRGSSIFNNNPYVPNRDSFQSKFNNVVSSSPDASNTDKSNLKSENSQKFQKIISETPSTENNYNDNSHKNHENDVTKLTRAHVETTTTPTEFDWLKNNKIPIDIASTTSTTKLTTTTRLEKTSTTKSLTFPTRATRVNPAIKLAATNPGGGRRSYQSSSKCATDNSLQANPKCNEIKYQRPSSPTRGRGSAHYTQSQGETPQQQSVNRGTPPTRSRPTLKPSTAVVTNPHPIIDIYTNPPRRPAPVYPQPTPDKTAAKCRKDVCLLPDCYCGGKDIPGDLPVESLPQIVLLTFDDSVNDLNKGLYADLFEKGRVNPNGCPISATFYVSHEWTDYSQVQNLYSAGHEMASHTISHSFGEQFSQKKWNREVSGQREILAAYGGVKLEDVRGMRAPFLSVGGNKMFKMLYDSNFTYDSSLPVYENRPPSWPYTLDYKLFHDCMIPPCPTKSYPGVWEVPMVMWQDLNGGRCSMGDACANPPEAEGVYKMLLKNFDRHYTTNRAPFGLFYHAAWFTQPHHKAGFIMFLDFINQMPDVWIVTNWQALQWVRDPTPLSRLNNFQPFQCNYQDRPKKCNNPKVCNLWHKSGVRYMRTCQPCPEIYPWTGKSGIKSSRIDNEIEE